MVTSIGLRLGRRVAMVNAVPSKNADIYWDTVSRDVMGGTMITTNMAIIIDKRAIKKNQKPVKLLMYGATLNF